MIYIVVKAQTALTVERWRRYFFDLLKHLIYSMYKGF
jgi:hypothetical protein